MGQSRSAIAMSSSYRPLPPEPVMRAADLLCEFRVRLEALAIPETIPPGGLPENQPAILELLTRYDEMSGRLMAAIH